MSMTINAIEIGGYYVRLEMMVSSSARFRVSAYQVFKDGSTGGAVYSMTYGDREKAVDCFNRYLRKFK